MADVADYIDTSYNRTRRHGHLGGVSPEQFEAVTGRGERVSTESWKLHFARRSSRVCGGRVPLSAQLLEYRRTIFVIAHHVLRNTVPFENLGADYFDRIKTTKRTERFHLRRLALRCVDSTR